jgi:hypothetical protein
MSLLSKGGGMDGSACYKLVRLEAVRPGDFIDEGGFVRLEPPTPGQGEASVNVLLASGRRYTELAGANIRVWLREHEVTVSQDWGPGRFVWRAECLSCLWEGRYHSRADGAEADAAHHKESRTPQHRVRHLRRLRGSGDYRIECVLCGWMGSYADHETSMAEAKRHTNKPDDPYGST